MTIAVIQDSTCVNVCEFGSIETAQEFFKMGVWKSATEILEAPEGYGIGDTYSGGEWTKRVEPEPEETETDTETTETVTTDAERLTALEDENKQLNAKLTAASSQITMLEDCIVELAQTVYA